MAISVDVRKIRKRWFILAMLAGFFLLGAVKALVLAVFR
jgi:hypothetical protein